MKAVARLSDAEVHAYKILDCSTDEMMRIIYREGYENGRAGQRQYDADIIKMLVGDRRISDRPTDGRVDCLDSILTSRPVLGVLSPLLD